MPVKGYKNITKLGKSYALEELKNFLLKNFV